LGDDTPGSLLAVKKKMTDSVDKDRATQQKAIVLYHKYLLRIATDVSRTDNKEKAAFAVADILGLSLSLDLNRDSTSAHPAVAAYLRSNQRDSIKVAVNVISPEPVTSASQSVLVHKGSAARVDLKLAARPAPYAAFPIKVECLASWHGLTAKVHSVTAGCPTIPCWWVAAPFANRGNDRTDKTPLVKNIDVNGTCKGKDGVELSWTKVVRSGDSLVVDEVVPDFSKMFGELKDVSAYAVTFFDCPSARDALLRIGSDDGVIVWLNGECVHINMVARGYDSGQDQAQLHLKAGRNTLLVETTQSWGGWKMGAHILDINGIPFDDLKFVK
jgi:hypothetical protein